MTERRWRDRLRRPDDFVKFFAGMGAGIYRHRRRAGWVALGIVFFAVAVTATLVWRGRVDRQAADALQPLIDRWDGESANGDGQKLLGDLRSFLDRYGSTSPAASARLIEGRLLLTLGRPEEALDVFRGAAKKLSEPSRSLALEGEASALVELGRWEDAVTAWRALTERETNPLSEAHLWNLGLALEGAKRTAEAVETYGKLVKEFPESGYRERAEERMTALAGGAKTP